MPADPVHFFDLDADALDAWVVEQGMQRFRAGQLRRWVYERGVTDPENMTDFSKADRRLLAERMVFTRWSVQQEQAASDGTRKLLLADETTDPPLRTECVMIPAESRDSGRARRTACISSQVGCPVGCRFCASGLGGLEANLTAGQIVEQAFQIAPCGLTIDDSSTAAPGQSATSNRRSAITNIVFMGMGEPLSNLAAVMQAVRTLAADWGFGISGRRITISTVGLPAQMRRLADQLNVPVTLAISLHAPNDELRRELIPWASRTSIEQIVEAGRYYFQQTGREVTLEYILLGEVNDRVEHARQLASVARRLRCNVNLIRYNEVAGLPYQRPAGDDVLAFERTLRAAGVNTHIRASRGRDIAAACGQLKHEATGSTSV